MVSRKVQPGTKHKGERENARNAPVHQSFRQRWGLATWAHPNQSSHQSDQPRRTEIQIGKKKQRPNSEMREVRHCDAETSYRLSVHHK